MYSKIMHYFLGLVLICAVAIGVSRIFMVARNNTHTVLFVSASTISLHEKVRDYFFAQARGLADKGVEVKALSISDPTDMVAISAVCERAVNEPSACVVVVGRTLAQVLVNTAVKREKSISIIFIGAQAPVELGLVASLEQPGGNATGVICGALDGALPVRLLHSAYPTAKSVLLPFYVAQGASEETVAKLDAAREYGKSVGINITPLPLDNLNDALRRIEGILAGYEVMMTLEGDGLNDLHMVGLARLARRYDIAFFPAVIDAYCEGALFAYAHELSHVVAAAFEQVEQILYANACPSAMPVICHTSSREFIINQKRAAELGLTIDVDAVIEKINADPALECVRGRVRVV
ncbi:MAG: putative tryptophan/tyrosine transport system substrate-binding protein [Candidatus Dependentiae bacterium]|nr:putative tryptophan/tyrosine transport system substrate-binding protein [Candidatus Dependentiae bacterium]